MERIHGPYEEGPGKWRIIVVGADGRRASKACKDEASAHELAAALRRKAAERTVADGVREYLDYLQLKGNTERSRKTTLQRLTRLIHPVQSVSINTLSTKRATELYHKLVPLYAVATHRDILSEARNMGRWMVRSGLIKVNPWLEVEPVGKRNRRKPQLRIDEARILWDYVSRDLSNKGNLAVAVIVQLGLRASELIGLAGRDIDDRGRVLWIVKSKTVAGERRLDIPPELQEALLARAQMYPARLFPHDRRWVTRMVKRRCVLAGIPHTSAHGLRGLHATLKVDFSNVSRALGHTKGRVTQDHYIAPGTVERSTARRVRDVLGN